MAGRAIDREAAKAAILESLAGGNTRKASYRAAGIDDATFFRWLADESFASACLAAEARPEVACVTAILQAARKDWRAAAWWLERKRAADWKEQKEVQLRDLTSEQLLELVRRGEGDPESAGDRLATGAPGGAGPDGLPE